MNKFELGQTVMTRGVSEKIATNLIFAEEVTNALRRYRSCDWGEMDDEDKALNDEAISGEDRIFAAYELTEGKIWIITEWDRSVTTILFPSEY